MTKINRYWGYWSFWCQLKIMRKAIFQKAQKQTPKVIMKIRKQKIEVNKIFVFGFGKYYAVSSYLICNRVTLTFPFLRQLSILEKKDIYIFRKDRCRRVCLLVLPLTTTSTPLTNLVFSLLRSSSANCLLTKVCWSLPIRRKYSIIIIIHEMTLDLTFSSLHAEPGIVIVMQNSQSLSLHYHLI